MDAADIRVREATEADAGVIVGFQQAMALETEGKFLERSRVEKGVGAVFQSPEKGFYLIAEAEGRAVASLLVTYEWSDWRNGTFLWIQSVYVDPSWRRKGAYRVMHARVLEIAHARGDGCGVRLYVERENAVAHRTYLDLGMNLASYLMFEVDFVL